MHAAEHDRARGHAGRIAGELQAVAGKIGNVLNLAIHVIMGQNGGVFFLFKGLDLVHEGQRIFLGVEGQKISRHDPLLSTGR